MSNKEYLSQVPSSAFEQMLPRRRAIIGQASDALPKYEYNANVLAKELHPKVQHVRVSAVLDLPDAKCYTLLPDHQAGTEKLAYFLSGQYISLHLTIGDSVVTRPYSLCSSPKEALNGEYKIVVKKVHDGFASEYIHKNFRVGTKLTVSAPSGFFYYEPLRDPQHVVGIAGGSGIAPFLSMAASIADGTEDYSLTLLYGSRKESDILFKDDLAKLCRNCPKIRVIHVLSDEEKEGYEHGFICSDLIRKYAPEESYSLFVCGSAGMYDYIAGQASQLGLKKKQVRMDAYGEYKLSSRDDAKMKEHAGKTYELTVVTHDGITKTIPARSSETILVALERAGIEAPSLCRSGECGFCRSRLTYGEVYTPSHVEHRRQYDQVTGYIHPCCTFPCSDCKINILCEEPKIERMVKNMKKKERTMGLVMSIIISAAMGALAAFLVLRGNPEAAAGTPVPMMYISNILLSVVVGILVALFVPLGKMGRGLARKANANPPSMKFTLLNAIPLSIGNTLIVSLVVSFFGIFMARSKASAESLAHMPPLPVMWLANWGKLLVPTMIVSYLLAVILSPLVSQMVGIAGAGAEVGQAASSNN